MTVLLAAHDLEHADMRHARSLAYDTQRNAGSVSREDRSSPLVGRLLAALAGALDTRHLAAHLDALRDPAEIRDVNAMVVLDARRANDDLPRGTATALAAAGGSRARHRLDSPEGSAAIRALGSNEMLHTGNNTYQMVLCQGASA